MAHRHLSSALPTRDNTSTSGTTKQTYVHASSETEYVIPGSVLEHAPTLVG